MKHFDPFSDRLSRDIRNDLSTAFMISLQQLELSPVEIVADRYHATDLLPLYRNYIEDRLTRYRQAILIISRHQLTDAFARSLVLWDKELFFEVHELLEHEWLQSSGATKNILQAMIRAAGMYVQLDHGNTKGAASMATKAAAAFQAHKDMVPAILDIDLLISRLESRDRVPPKLSDRVLSGREG